MTLETHSPVQILGDGDLMREAVSNLIGNAIKFTPQGFVEVSVAAADERIAMTVNDSGIGMTPEVRAVIFEAFRQGDASMTRPYGGVGLGLYIVARLVEALRGRITVESEPGRGSTFRIEIPLDARGVRATVSSRR
jgi:signal transduction histidine kinase